MAHAQAFSGGAPAGCWYQIRVFEGLRHLGSVIVQDFFLLFMKCLFKDPIVVMLTLLTLITLLRVNVNML